MTARRTDPLLIALGALVGVSLVANAVLLVRWRARPSAPAPGPEVTKTRAPAPAFTSAWRQPFPGLARAGAGAAMAPVTLDGCVQGTARLETELAQLDRLAETHTPPAQRFQAAPPNTELTTAFTAALDRHIPLSGGSPIHAQCRGELCRVVVPLANRDDPRLAAFRESQFAGENLRELDPDDEGLLFEKKQHPDLIRGSDILQNALQDFEASGAIEECQKKGTAQGTLDAHITINPAEGGASDEPTGISVRPDGALAGTPVGTCIHTALQRSLAALTLPEHYDRASLSAQYPRP